MDEAALMRQLDGVVRASLENYDFSPEATVSLVNVSENSTFRVDDPRTGRSAALRVHRPAYHSESDAGIESELSWMDALRAEGIVTPPVPIAAKDGSRVTTVTGNGNGPPRYVVLFEWLPGQAPDSGGDLVPSFRKLGTLAAKMHLHGMSWERPTWFTRFTVDYDAAIGRKAMWGRWQDGLGMGPSEVDLFSRVDSEIQRRLAEHGRGSERFGLVHGDLRLANVLVDGETAYLIDFDDCGFSWFMYDFGTAVSFIEDDPRVPELMWAWIDGYTEVRPLPRSEIEIIPTMVMLRRMLLIGWVGSHYEYADEAVELGVDYTTSALDIAETYLAGTFLVSQS
jgi:Ser/Thr protein kinase RdoA (MazF antagonist)